MKSIKSFIFILFLCLPLHACNARLFDFVDQVSPTSHIHFSGKLAEKVDLNMDPRKNGGQAINDKNNDIEGNKEAKETETNVHDLLKKLKYTRELVKTGFVPKKPIVTVSRHLPENNDNQNNQGIFSDYSRPRTRPPSHN